MSELISSESDTEALQTAPSREVLAGRIDFLYRLGRFYLFFPFAALGMAVTLFNHRMPEIVAVTPLLLMIAGTVAGFRLTRAYDRRDPSDDPRIWARRYTILSAITGAFWGVGAVIWFVPDSFPAQAYLSLAFLGMTAAEFIARAVHRPAYLAHATFSLLPLAAMLLLDGHGYANMTALLVLFFGGVLYSYCNNFTQLIDESIRLRFDNAALVTNLSREKHEAETARDAAQASSKAKSAFISNISHEIRTPLNALLGMAQLLEQSPLEHAQRSHMRVILEAGRGLKTLLDDVIALSREEGGIDTKSAAWGECDAANAARTVARLLQPRAWEKKLVLSVTTAPTLPCVAGDPRRVRQLLLKLVENGLKFTETGSVDIAVSTETDEAGLRFVRFNIADTGHGIPPEVAAHLFEPFTAGDTSYSRRYQGAGLGLAVAKRIVDSLGGKIGFDSTPGQGTAFWFTLPTMAQMSGAGGSVTDATPPSQLRLLVCTHDRSVRGELAKLLEPFGNTIVFAGTTAEAVTRASREDFDGIIVDGAQADMLGASPGVKAPILALLSSNARAPVCASQIVRGPVDSTSLYGALNAMFVRISDAAGFAPDAPVPIDPGAFASLEKSLGLATLIEILQSYIATAEQLCATLNEASEESHWDEAARAAQDIAGAAGGLGLAALTTSARNFAQKAREGSDSERLQFAAHEVIYQHQRVRDALASLYPDLAA